MMKQKENQDYQHLHELSHEIGLLRGISGLLDWDQETYMPQGAAEIRSEQIQLLAGMIHEKRTSNNFKETLSKLVDLESGQIKGQGLSERQKTALKEWYRDYRLERSLPSKFVKDFAKLTVDSILTWRQAREENNFKKFAPSLEKIIDMSRKKAEYMGYNDHPYDALLDLYEPGMTAKEVEHVFSGIKKGIVSLLKKIQSKNPVDDSFLHGKFSHAQQMAFAKKILHDIGYDMQYGRLDFSTHPFSSASHPTDSRITTRIHPTFLMSSISVILHEAGHGMYEMGLPIEEFGTPLGEPVSLGIHESQSRWWETRMGQCKPFWKHYLPILKQHFKGKLDEIPLNTFYKGLNKVQPSFIRVDADEVTYPLHVILRFELERALIEGSMSVKEIPEAWNAKMQELLGVTPPNDKKGCLQDIHWSMGGFGYFPTYTLGNLYAAQLFQTFEKKHTDWEKRVAKGEFAFVKDWLQNNIYNYGRQYNSKELLKKVTGKAFSSTPYQEYLETKYKDIYSIK